MGVKANWWQNGTIILLLIIILLGHDNMSLAGVLDDFEKDATEKNTPSKSSNSSSYSNGYDPGSPGSDNPMFDIFGDLFVNMFYMTTSASWIRVNYETQNHTQIDIINQMNLQKREKGELLIPFFRFDYHYQNIESDVDASDYRLIVGYGPLGFMGRKTFLREDEPFDKLRIDQFYGVLRMSLTNYVELGLGFGEYRLVGNNRNSSFSFAMPVTVRPHKNIAVEFIPAWTTINNNEIEDFDLGVLLGTSYISLKTGFRWIESPNDHLRGPYIGLSLYF